MFSLVSRRCQLPTETLLDLVEAITHNRFEVVQLTFQNTVDRLSCHFVRDHIYVGHEDVTPLAGVELLTGGFFRQ